MCHIKTRFNTSFFILCLFLSMAFFCLVLPSISKAEKLDLRYAMYAGGFQAMTIDMQFDFNAPDKAPSYHAALHAKPYGFLGHFLPWAGEYSVTGITKQQQLYPTSHIKISRWREDMDQYDMVYRDGKLVSIEKQTDEDGTSVKEYLVPDPEFTENTVDIMTAAIRTMHRLQNGENCSNASDVFDGKRRLRLSFTDQGKETLSKTRYNIFEGATILCEVEMIPLKGYKKKPQGYYKIQEAARAKGNLPQVWFGQVGTSDDNNSGSTKSSPRYVPVKMLVKSDFGAILIHLQNVTSSGKTPTTK